MHVSAIAQISPSNEQTLSKTAQACLEQAVEIPAMPLYHMGNIAVFNSKSSFDLMQATIDYLTCKAKAKMPFSNIEKTFLIELYESFWWGGHFKQMHEAARLANHYVHGKGVAVKMTSQPYENSVVVQDAMEAMKGYIAELSKRNEYFFTLKSDDPKFRRSKHFKPLMLINNSRNIVTQGYVESNGRIYADQGNSRLKYADNRFYLTANTQSLERGSFHTRWSVKNIYDFEPFSRGDKISDLHLSQVRILKLPDGLSEYMDTGLNIAQSFNYIAEWSERWWSLLLYCR